MKVSLSTNTATSGKFRTRIKNQDGSETPWSPWFSNIILNQGMDRLPVGGYYGVFAYCHRGKGVTPVRRNTIDAAVTLSQSETTVTSTGNFFLSTDVGARIKWGASGSSGNELIITGYTSATQVTVGTSATVSSSAAVVWLVNQTQLATPYDYTNLTFESSLVTTDATGGGTGIPTYTMRNGFQFPAVTGSHTFTEIGIAWGNGNTDLFSRVLVPGAGDTLTDGQIYEVEYSLTVQMPAGASQASVADTAHPSGDAFSTAGVFMQECYGLPSSSLSYNDAYCAMTPYGGNAPSKGIQAITADWTQRTLIANSNPTLTITRCDSCTDSAYSAGTYTTTRTTVFNVGTANVTWYGIACGDLSQTQMCWTIKFTTPKAKDSNHTMTFVHSLTWSRVFTN